MRHKGIAQTRLAGLISSAVVILSVTSNFMVENVAYGHVPPGISVSVSASPTTVNAGGTVTYSVVVTNTGPTDLQIWVTDSAWGPITSNVLLPAGQTVTYTLKAIPNQSVTNTVTAIGMYGFGVDMAPSTVSAQGSASVTVNGAPPQAVSVAYIYTSDDSFKTFLDANGYPTTLVPMSSVSATNFSSFNLIIAGSETGYGYSWGDAASVAAVRNSGKPIVGLGYGGSCLFQQLGLSINWGNGWVGPLNQIYVVDPALPIFNLPKVVAIPENRLLTLYSSSDHIGEYAPYISPSVQLLGREPNNANHYPLVQEGRNVLWGFTASPAGMTDSGKQLFLNLAAYAAALPASVLPDLVITDFWRDNGRISYQIMNSSAATAPGGHLTSLSIDGVVVARDLVDHDLAPGERQSRSFDFTWVSSDITNTMAVTADSVGVIVESDETNNSRSAVWKYDETPPRITSGPEVSGITQNSATISWQTDETSDSLVRYGVEAGRYPSEKGDDARTRSHQVTLADLSAARAYHFTTRSADPSGNMVESQDMWFQTLAPTTTTQPTVLMADIGVLSGVSRLSATASDDVEKVEFVVDGKLAYTAYAQPFDFVADTTTLANGDHDIIVSAVNSSGITSVYNTAFKVNNTVLFGPTVKIISPANGETVSGTITVVVEASVKTGLRHLCMDVDGGYLSTCKDFPMPYPTSGTYSLTLDTLAVDDKWGSFPGWHTLGVYTYGTPTEPMWVGDSVMVHLVNTPPPPPPKLVVTSHRATMKGNYFTIDVTVQNVGDDVASNVVVKDNLILFQPILSSSSLYDVSTDLGGYNVAAQNVIIKGKVDIPPGQSIDYAFDAVPILPYPGGAYPFIGNAEIELSWNAPHQSWLSTSSISFPVVQTTSGQLVGAAYETATKTSDYLIVTSPENLQRYNAKEDVAKLLSKMAELARLKNGVLGYLDVASSLSMTYGKYDGFAVGDIIDDAKAELIIGDQAGGEIHVYGTNVPTAIGVQPPVEWKEMSHIKCGSLPFAQGDRIAVGDVKGFTKKQIIAVHGVNSSVSICNAAGGAIIPSFFLKFQPSDGFAVGDVNGDGKDEIIVGSVADHMIYVYEGAAGDKSQTPAPLYSFGFDYKAGDGLAIGDVLGSSPKQIIVASMSDSALLSKVFILSYTGAVLDSFPKMMSTGDAIAVGKPIVSWGDDKDEIVFTQNIFPSVAVWKQVSGSTGWGGIKWFSRPVQPFFGLALGNVFGGQGDDIVIADWNEKSIDFHRAGDAAGDKHVLHDLIQASGGSWAAKLKSDWSSQGYLLIVGETEIVPAYGGKTFGTALMVTGWEEIRADVTDYPYASTAGEEIKPELSIGRIIGNTAIELMKPIETSIAVAKQQAGYGFKAKTMFPVSGFPGTPPNNIDFQSEMIDVAIILKNKGLDGLAMFNTDYAVYNAQGQFDKPATDAVVVPKFFANTPDKDIIFLAGHGNAGSWDAITSNDVMARTAPFGSTNPFVFASSCMTGMYFVPNSFAEAFLQRGAGAYLGATNWGMGSGDWVAKSFFEKWDLQQEPVGLAVKKVKQSIGDQQGDYWSAIYHVYGDPKFPFVLPYYVPTPGSPVTAGAYATAIQVPDYHVTRVNGADQVWIEGGQALAVPGLPEVPSYRVFYDIPKGVMVQDVTLESRSEPVSDTGLNVPDTSMAIVAQSGSTADLSPQPKSVDWWPQRSFDWSVIEGPESNTLAITVYPFDYNPLTTDARFYKSYRFIVTSRLSSVDLTGLATNKESYAPGEPVTLSLALENKGTESKDVIVSASVRDEGTGEAVGGLRLRTLKGLKGRSSYSGTWDSRGMPPGYYCVRVELRDANGTLLDHKTKTFRLNALAGEIAGFSATPETFDIGNPVVLSLTFKNAATQSISGLAVIRVLDKDRKPVAEFSHEITSLPSTESVTFNDSWSAEAPGTYAATGVVLYDGKTSRTAELTIESNTPHAEAGPDQTVERSGPNGAQVTFDGSKSYSPLGLQLFYRWSWTGGTAEGVSPKVSLPMGDMLVTLTVSDGRATATDAVNIRVVDATPPTVQIGVPASGEAVQDGLWITADASDLSGVAGVYFWIREPTGLKGASLGYDAAAGALKSGSAGTWEYQFDSSRLPDGYYVVMAKAVDNFGNESWSQIVPFTIRNWSVFELLPATPNNNAGRTMPVRFALRIAKAVDAAQPFVHNEQLTIKICGGGQVLQTSVYGSKSTDYRIDDKGQAYITNFQTLKSPMPYTVEVWRKGLLIGSFTFATTK